MTEKRYDIVAVLDTMEDKLLPQSLELIAFAESFSEGNLSATLIVLSGKNVLETGEALSVKYGLDIAVIEDNDLFLPNPELAADALYAILGRYSPATVIFTHTIRNCQCASKLSVLCNASSATAVESFAKKENKIVFQRSVFNGKLKEQVSLNTAMKILTILPGGYTLSENDSFFNKNGSVISYNLNELNLTSFESGQSPETPGEENYFYPSGYKPVLLSAASEGGVNLEDADVIVSAGRGIGNMENLELVRRTAAIFPNSAVGASRPVCDQKWVPLNQQVGVTGKTVAPRLYIACGISGSQQHIAGMKNSQCIVAINKDPNASIFSVADYIVVEDIVSFLPVLLNKYYKKYG